jgi:hypothetical protein
MPRSLFAPMVPDNKANPMFLVVRDHDAQSPGRELMKEIFSQYYDKDGNFVKDFQSTGFSARVWELSLFAFLLEAGVTLERTLGNPDYVLTSPHSVALEAVTSQPVGGVLPSSLAYSGPNIADIFTPVDLDDAQAEFVFQLGKILRRKLQKRFSGGLAYWDLPQCRGKPFVLAVQAFHSASSLFHTVSFAQEYLFGQRQIATHDQQGKLAFTAVPITKHVWQGKDISSGLFQQSDAVNLSAVLFSNSGTVAQFNRIGLQQGLGSSDILILRRGACAYPDEDADLPLIFAYVVGEPGSPVETFAQAMHVIHNPNALIPLPPGAFPGALEHRLDSENGLVECSYRGGFSPFFSVTDALSGPGAGIVLDGLRRQNLTASFGVSQSSRVRRDNGPES